MKLPKSESDNEPEIIAEVVQDFLKTHGQDELLPQVTQEFKRLVGEEERNEIIITSAIPLTDSQQNTIQKIIKNKYKKDLPVINTVDKKIIAGFTIQIDDWYLDASIARYIENLTKLLLN